MKIKNEINKQSDHSQTQPNSSQPSRSRLKLVAWIVGILAVLGIGIKMSMPQTPKQPSHHTTAVGTSSSSSSSSTSDTKSDTKSAQKVDDAEKAAAAKQKAQAEEANKKIQEAKIKDAKSHGQNSVDMLPIIKKGLTAYYNNPDTKASYPSARKSAVEKKIGKSITTQAMDQLINPDTIKNEQLMSVVTEPNLSEPLEVTATKGLNGYYDVVAHVKNFVGTGKKRHEVQPQTDKYIVETNHNKITAISQTSGN